jgi:hypothetical protein
MKLPEDAIIAYEKLTRYLLIIRKRNDKSQWLAKAGYTLDNWYALEKDIRTQILPLDANPVENTQYGHMYEIIGNLKGPNGKNLSVCTVWMTEKESKKTKFITMYPVKKEK